MATIIDILFPVRGLAIPTHHGYSLFSAICHLVPVLHQHPSIGIFPIAGTLRDRGLLNLRPTSSVRLRLPVEDIPIALALAGKSLNLDGHEVRLGAPRVMALVPASSLRSRIVVIKISGSKAEDLTPSAFLDAVYRQLGRRSADAARTDVAEASSTSEPRLLVGLDVSLAIPLHPEGPHAGEPIRRIVRVKSQTHVGFPLIVTGLSADESLALQSQGLGGRRKMGCGLFVPA